jgi:hypothetical protein
LEIEKVSAISDEMRAFVESEWPELGHKLPQTPDEAMTGKNRIRIMIYPQTARIAAAIEDPTARLPSTLNALLGPTGSKDIVYWRLEVLEGYSNAWWIHGDRLG